jgi:lysophospholipase L1-like esterase
MVTGRALATLTLVGAVLLAGCGWLGTDTRGLPGDRAAEVVYVALGDSTVEGIGASSADTSYVSRLHARLREHYPRAVVHNLGVGGATSADVLGHQLEQAVGLGPHLVTVSVGPNDITGRVAVETYDRNVSAILARLREATRAVVVVNSLPDLAVTPRFRRTPMADAVGRLSVRFNEALARRVAEHGFVLVDLYHPSQAEVPVHPDLVSRDGYHPSDAGYARWAELLWAGIEPLVVR